MNETYPLATTAALIADRARASMLVALLDGRALPAGELARIARISAQSASMHLSQLVTGGFLAVTPVGRHRYYRIARPEIVHAIESLGSVSTPDPVRKPDPRPDRELCYARTCYDHLAGELGVQVTDAFLSKRLLADDFDRNFQLTDEGIRFFRGWGIDAAHLRRVHRTFARKCLDWTERRHHLAGALGAAICDYFLESQWLRRTRDSRAVILTAKGQEQFESILGLRCRAA